MHLQKKCPNSIDLIDIMFKQTLVKLMGKQEARHGHRADSRETLRRGRNINSCGCQQDMSCPVSDCQLLKLNLPDNKIYLTDLHRRPKRERNV
jgi:hypothetical protein